MSHIATNWAFSQRGLKPAAKLVLLCLADRHNPDLGCFPSQERLCEDAEMSRSSLNDHLADLEEKGLLIRHRRRNEKSRRQQSTEYYFAFEATFEAIKNDAETVETSEIPCPEFGHGKQKAVSEKDEKPCPEKAKSRVRNSDTNPVREPVRVTSEKERVSDVEEEGKADRGSDNVGKVSAETWLRRFRKAHAAWPTYVTDSEPKAREAWFALEPDERQTAADRAADYVQVAKENGRKMVCAFAVYLGQKPWEKLPERAAVAAPEAAERQNGPAFGKAWAAHRLRILMGPMAARIPAPTVFITKLIEAGGPDGERHRQAHLARYGWPEVNHMHERAELYGGAIVRPADVAAGADFQPVRVGSPLFEAWRVEHEARGWPWLTAPKRVEWVYFPASEGDDQDSVRKALAAFLAATEMRTVEAVR